MSNIPFESFIFQTYIDDLDLCDEIIKTYQKSTEKVQGKINISNKKLIDKKIKNSTEISLNDCPNLYYRYGIDLQKCLNRYIEKYASFNWYSPVSVVEPINIQHYEPGNSYSVWHTERTGIYKPISDRVLVFMTYLNDVTDQGGTEFYNQKIITEPKRGLTLMWPADWTHTHRGIASPSQHKYIATGWINYVERLK
jgi:hypothetical protein